MVAMTFHFVEGTLEMCELMLVLFLIVLMFPGKLNKRVHLQTKHVTLCFSYIPQVLIM